MYFAGKCPLEELKELPVRLIDWFHVLKINQRQKEFIDQRIEGEELLPRMKFSEAKLKALCKCFLGFTLSHDYFESLLLVLMAVLLTHSFLTFRLTHSSHYCFICFSVRDHLHFKCVSQGARTLKRGSEHSRP